jgi:hypothetical protein
MVEEIVSGVGLRHVQILALDTNGYPNTTATTAYEGITISGAKAFDVTDPEPRRITHTGDDRVIALDVLPPNEPMSGTITVGKINDDVDAVLSDDKSFTVGAAEMFGVGTDNRGEENQVCLMCYQQALDTDPASGSFGLRRFRGYIFPKTLLVRQEAGMNNDPAETTYNVYPQLTKEHVWGTAFSTTTEGFELAQGVRFISQYKPKLAAFNGDTTTTTFTLPTDVPAASTATIAVWVNGTADTSWTLTTTNITTSEAPQTDQKIVVFYESEYE